MTEESQFIGEITSNPYEFDPRLVYADWLDENGDERGKYLRAELEFANADPESEYAKVKFRQLAVGLLNKKSSVNKAWVQEIGIRFDYWLMRLKYRKGDYFSEVINASVVDTVARAAGLNQQDATKMTYSKLPTRVTSNVTINNLIALPHQFGSPDPESRPDPKPFFLISKHEPDANQKTSMWAAFVKRFRKDSTGR